MLKGSICDNVWHFLMRGLHVGGSYYCAKTGEGVWRYDLLGFIYPVLFTTIFWRWACVLYYEHTTRSIQ